MTQFDFGTINANTKSGGALAADLMAWRNALHSGHRGTTAPTYAAAGMLWVDDTNATLWLVKRYDGTNWIVEEAIDTSSKNAWAPNLGERLRYPIAGGTANALTLTPAVAITAYLDTDVMTLQAASNNSAAATLNVSGVGAKAIRKIVGGSDVALAPGDIVVGGRYTLHYTAAAAAGAGAWILVNPSGSIVITSNDAGATGGPDIDAFRDSASPAVSDILARLLFNGRDSAANKQLYALIQAIITDPTTATEDAVIDFQTVVNAVVASRMQLGAGLFLAGATGGDPGAGKFNAVEVQQNNQPIRPRITSAAVATTSGTSFDFTGIDSWATKITVHFKGVSLSGTDNFLVQIGNGTVSTTGYVSSGALLISAANASIVSATSGMIIAIASASLSMSGDMTLTLQDPANNVWVASHSFGMDSTFVSVGGGTKSLSGALDRVRVTRNGSNTFDAGSISISWE